jgi:hypothetical protein
MVEGVHFPAFHELMASSIPSGYPLLCPFCSVHVPDCVWDQKHFDFRYTAAPGESHPTLITNQGICWVKEHPGHPLVCQLNLIHSCDLIKSPI